MHGLIPLVSLLNAIGEVTMPLNIECDGMIELLIRSQERALCCRFVVQKSNRNTGL